VYMTVVYVSIVSVCLFLCALQS